MKRLNLFVSVLLAVLFMSSCGRGDDDQVVHIHKTDFTAADQSKIGEEIQNYIVNDPFLFPMLEKSTNAEVYNYINTLVTTLINTTEITNRAVFDWEVTILEDDEVRSAFAAPGGKLFIYTGLLKFITGENELASILAHEISYTETGTVIENLHNQYASDQLFLGDILLGKEVDGMDQLCLFLKDMSYSESEVIEADNFSIGLICPFQYNSLGIKTIIDEANQTSTKVKWLDNRPSAFNRVDNIVEKSVDCGEEEDPTFSERYAEYKKLLP